MIEDQTLYARLGGETAIAAVVEGFYDRVLDDPQLMAYFEDTDMDALRRHQTEFLCLVTGGPTEYSGGDMRPAHAHLELDDEDFDAVAGHLQAALESFDVPEEHVGTVLEEVESVRPEVLDR